MINKMKSLTWNLRTNRDNFTKSTLKNAIKSEPSTRSIYSIFGFKIPLDILPDLLLFVDSLKSNCNKRKEVENWLDKNESNILELA